MINSSRNGEVDNDVPKNSGWVEDIDEDVTWNSSWRSGVGFPQRSANAAPIFTPPATHPTDRLSQAGYGMPSNTARRLDEAMASEMENLSYPFSLSNLDSMRSVMELLNDMLQAVNPNDREAIKDEVIVDLVSQCRSNQKKLMQLLNSTGDEELLGQGLELNDNIQGLLAKHDAIASGSPLPAETTGSGHGPTAPTAAVADLPLSKTLSSGPGGNAVAASSAVVSERIEEEEEDEDDDFAQLARRRSKARPVPSDGTYDGTFSVAATASGTSASSAPIDSNALVLSNPPHPVRTTNKEQDIIDLLSLTLTTSGSSPHTPLTPPTSIPQTPPSNSNQTGPVAHNEQGYPYATQPYPMNQGQVPYSYVVPWAQPQTQPQPQAQAHPQFQTQSQVPENSYGYPPPPWASATNNHYNPSTSSSPYSYQGARTDTGSPYASRALQQHNSFSSRGNSFPVSQGSPSAARPLQHYNSFGSRTNNLPASLKEAQVNPTVGHGAPTMGNKPFVPSYRLFEDLIDLRSSGVKSNGLSQTSSLSGSAGQSMVGGRK
ncbi:hypothetical protein ACLOJK_023162 [Asimina triloba]